MLALRSLKRAAGAVMVSPAAAESAASAESGVLIGGGDRRHLLKLANRRAGPGRIGEASGAEIEAPADWHSEAGRAGEPFGNVPPA